MTRPTAARSLSPLPTALWVSPPSSTLTAGKGTFSATLQNAGPQTITATDTVHPTITGTSGKINVT